MREQLHLNKAKFPYLDQWESCLVYQPFVSSCRFYGLQMTGQNICYSGVNCALGPSKSIRYSGDFVIAQFITAGFVSIYLTVILPGFYVLFVIAGFVIAGCHCMKECNRFPQLMTASTLLEAVYMTTLLATYMYTQPFHITGL